MHIKKSSDLSRRKFLRGVGVTMALPFMESLSPAGRALAQAVNKGALGENGEPIRFAAFFMANGVNREAWTPKKGKLKELPRTLQPLDAMKEHVNVITGINNTGHGHELGTASLLTGASPYRTEQTTKINVYNPSIDQIIGEAFKDTCVFPSIELGIGTPAKAGTTSTNNIYRSYISWKNGTTPIPYEVNPQRAFDRLFKSITKTNAEANANAPSIVPKPSVIDAVLEDAKSLEKKLGREDRAKLDEYFTAVREVEERIAQQNAIQGLQVTDDVLKGIRGLKSDIRKNMSRDDRDGRYQASPRIPQREHAKLLMDILALAFWSNSTRAGTLTFGNGLHGGGNMSFIDGVTGGHHQTSHHGFKEEKLEKFTLINHYYVEQYAYLLERLNSMKEGSSNVLENSIVFFGSNISTGQGHNGRNIPVLLSGNGGGKIKTGRHIEAGGQSIANLHRSILDNLNIRAKVGEGNKKLRGI